MDVHARDMPDAMRSMARELSSASLVQPLGTCREQVEAGFVENFQNQKGATGSQWPGRKDNLPHPLLILSEDLLRSTQEGGGQHIEEVSDRELSVGTSVLYAATQNFGDTSRNIPQREFLYASETTLDDCQDVVADYVVSEVLVF